MALTTTKIKRKFILESEDKDEITVKDPDSSMSAEEVRKFIANSHPEAATAQITGPKIEVIGGVDTAVYTLKPKFAEFG